MKCRRGTGTDQISRLSPERDASVELNRPPLWRILLENRISQQPYTQSTMGGTREDVISNNAVFDLNVVQTIGLERLIDQIGRHFGRFCCVTRLRPK